MVTRICPSERRGVSRSWSRKAWSSVSCEMVPLSTSRSPSRLDPGPQALTMRPWWKPISAVTSPRDKVSVPVRPPRWMNCRASATETSSRFPERLMAQAPRASAALDELDQALQRLQLAIGLVVDARGEQRRGGVGGEQVEELAVLGTQHRLVLEELEDDQRAHHRSLHGERHHGDGFRAVDGAH